MYVERDRMTVKCRLQILLCVTLYELKIKWLPLLLLISFSSLENMLCMTSLEYIQCGLTLFAKSGCARQFLASCRACTFDWELYFLLARKASRRLIIEKDFTMRSIQISNHDTKLSACSWLCKSFLLFRFTIKKTNQKNNKLIDRSLTNWTDNYIIKWFPLNLPWRSRLLH